MEAQNKPSVIEIKFVSYMENWREETWRHRFWQGYPEFQKASQSNMQVIMAETKAVIEAWFKLGVVYDRDLLELQQASFTDELKEIIMFLSQPSPYNFGIPSYINEPDELQGILEVVFGKIKASILEWKRIPEYLRPQLLMWSPASAKDKTNKTEASFEWGGNHAILPFGPVYWTEGRPPEERAELVGNDWLNLQSHWLFGIISEIYATESGQWKRPQSVRAIENYLEVEQRLKSLGLDQPNRLEYYACQQGFLRPEVSEMLRTISVNKTPEAVKKSYQRHRELMRTNYENS